MDQNWQNFLHNLGVWEGSFTSISADGEELESTPSILELEGFDNNQRVSFRLRRFPSHGYNGSPISEINQDYHTLGRQIIFFNTGAFSKGTMQFAPFSEFGAEYGFVAGNRRLRLVQLYNREGGLSSQVLIREFRQHSNALERPPLQIEQLIGEWYGTAHTCYASWEPSIHFTTHLRISQEKGYLFQHSNFLDQIHRSTAEINGNQIRFQSAEGDRCLFLLADGTSSFIPLHLPRHHPFEVEVGWLLGDNERQRLIRRYNPKGEWVSATHIVENKVI